MKIVFENKSCKINDANTYVFNYDNLYELVFADYNDGNSTGYGYDSLGNRTDVNMNGTVTSYVRDKMNQYTQVGGTNYSYDDNGNLTNDGTYSYYYDRKNRLTEVSHSDVNYPSTQNLVSWWKFDETSGTTAEDSAGDNNGTLINGTAWGDGENPVGNEASVTMQREGGVLVMLAHHAGQADIGVVRSAVQPEDKILIGEN